MPAKPLPHRTPLLGLMAAGLLLEAALGFGFLLPFNIGAHPNIIRTFQPPATILGTDLAGALRFSLPTVVAFAAYALAPRFVVSLPARRGLPIVLAFTVVFALTLLPINPVGSHDVYHNIADARIYWLHGRNPTSLPPAAFPNDPITRHVWPWQAYPSSYGPLWYQLSGAPLPFAGDALIPNVLGQKLLTALLLLATVVLTMLAAERIQAGTAAWAGLLVGWNPLLQFETAGNAHNDILMTCFMVAALYAICRRSWLAVWPLLALSVASKHVALLLAPLVLVWMVRHPAIPRPTIALSLIFGLGIAAALYVPLLAGGRGFVSFGEEASRITSSLAAALTAIWQRVFGLMPAEADQRARLMLVPLFLAGYLVLLWRTVRAVGIEAIIRLSFWAVFVFLVVVKWWFWPWYLIWLVPLAALLPRGRSALVATVFSLSAMLSYVVFFWQAYSDWAWQQTTTALTVLVAPVVVALIPYPLHRRLWPIREDAGAGVEHEPA